MNSSFVHFIGKIYINTYIYLFICVDIFVYMYSSPGVSNENGWILKCLLKEVFMNLIGYKLTVA